MPRLFARAGTTGPPAPVRQRSVATPHKVRRNGFLPEILLMYGGELQRRGRKPLGTCQQSAGARRRRLDQTVFACSEQPRPTTRGGSDPARSLPQ